MTPDQYRKHLSRLSLTQVAAGELFGATGRTGQTWASSGPPKPVAMVLLSVPNRAALDRLARRSEQGRLHKSKEGTYRRVYFDDQPEK